MKIKIKSFSTKSYVDGNSGQLTIIPSLILGYCLYKGVCSKKTIGFRFTIEFLQYEWFIQFLIIRNKLTQEERTSAMEKLAKIIAYDIVHGITNTIVYSEINDYNYDLTVLRDMITKEFILQTYGDQGNISSMSEEDLNTLNKSIDKWIIKKNK